MVYQAVASALAHKELIPEVELVKRTEDSRLSMSGKKHEPAPEPFEKNRLMAIQQQSAAKESVKEYTTSPGITEGFKKRLIPAPSQNILPEMVREPDELSANWLKPQASINKANTLEALTEALPETLPDPRFNRKRSPNKWISLMENCWSQRPDPCIS